MLPNPGPIALRAADEAIANLGVVEEGGENRGKYVEIYLRSVGLRGGDPWCAAFVSYRLTNAAKDLKLKLPADFPRSGWVPDYKAWGKKHGVWFGVGAAAEGSIEPKKGDLALFYFPAKNRVAHIGIVVSLLNSGVVTVEGNTGPERGTEVNRDGDGVYRKNRSWGELGTHGGFVRLGF